MKSRRKRGKRKSTGVRPRASEEEPRQIAGRREEKRPQGLKLWGFRLLTALAVPIALLVALELGLRVCGYGVPMDFVLRREVSGEKRILSNPHFTWRFFDPGSARSCTSFSLPATKPPDVFRVFVLGASAAKGDPAPAFGLARVLDVMLQDQYPGVDIQVVDVAAVAINSHAVLPIARACAKLQPDLFVVYLGNNEVVGAYGPGTAFALWRPNLAGIRAGIALRATRVVQFIRSTLRQRGIWDRGPQVWRGMEMFLNRRVRASDPRLQTTYKHFEQNLVDICRAGHGAGVPVIVSTVGVNLRDCAPFASLHREGMSDQEVSDWEAVYGRGVALEEQGRCADAVKLYLEAEQIEGDYADLQYRLGRCYWRLGESGLAHERYVKACGADTLRFRADTRINTIIRETAAARRDKGVRLVDAARVLCDSSPQGITGREYFHEHVHLKFAGTYRVATSIVEQARSVLPDRSQGLAAGRPILSEEECARLLAHTGWDRYRVAEYMLERLGQAPFSQQLDHDDQIARLSNEIAELKPFTNEGGLQDVSRQYAAMMQRADVHWQQRMRYAMLLTHGLDNVAEAERQWQMLVNRLPQDAGLHVRLGELQSRQSRYLEAEASFRTALRYQPSEPTLLSNLGAVLQAQGRLNEAIACLKQALAGDPDCADTLYNLAVCLLLLKPGDAEARGLAIEHCRKALDISPDDTECRKTLVKLRLGEAMTFGRLGDHLKAQQFLQLALALDPDCEEAHYNMAASFDILGDREGAVKHLSEVLRINPRNRQARTFLERFTKQGGGGRTSPVPAPLR